MMDFSVLANPLFLLVCVSNVLGFLALYIPYIYLPNAMISKVSIMHDTEYIVKMISTINSYFKKRT